MRACSAECLRCTGTTSHSLGQLANSSTAWDGAVQLPSCRVRQKNSSSIQQETRIQAATRKRYFIGHVSVVGNRLHLCDLSVPLLLRLRSGCKMPGAIDCAINSGSPLLQLLHGKEPKLLQQVHWQNPQQVLVHDISTVCPPHLGSCLCWFSGKCTAVREVFHECLETAESTESIWTSQLLSR